MPTSRARGLAQTRRQGDRDLDETENRDDKPQPRTEGCPHRYRDAIGRKRTQPEKTATITTRVGLSEMLTTPTSLTPTAAARRGILLDKSNEDDSSNEQAWRTEDPQ